jgi:hypothetical protein
MINRAVTWLAWDNPGNTASKKRRQAFKIRFM